METLFTILAFLSLLAFIVGLFNPKLVIPFPKIQHRGMVILIYFGLLMIFANIAVQYSPQNDSSLTVNNPNSEIKQNITDKDTSKQFVVDSINKNEISQINSQQVVYSFIESQKGDIIYARNDFNIEIKKIKDKKGAANILDRGHGKYRYYYLIITNMTRSAKEIYRDDFYLVDENGNTYKHYTTQSLLSFFTTVNRDAFGAGEALPPRVPADGVIAFEVPKDGKFVLKFKLQ